MNLLETITAQRQKLDAKVTNRNPQRTRTRRPMSAAQRKKLSAAKKEYWKNRKAAKK